jgi:biotin transport system substrate-specific component
LPFLSSASSSAMKSRQSLAAALWPSQPGDASGVLRAVVLVLFGTALLAISAKINLPLPYVPMTLQTLVVLMIGTVYGSRLGVATVVAYLAEGAMGLPVFAGSVGGLVPLMGPTAGYLVAFIAAAFITGRLSERGWDQSAMLLFSAMIAGHVLILAGGFVWLAFGIKLGADKAWLVGVAPFVAGSVVKSALGAALVLALRSAVSQRR